MCTFYIKISNDTLTNGVRTENCSANTRTINKRKKAINNLAMRASMSNTALHLLVGLFNSRTLSAEESHCVRQGTLDETVAFHGGFWTARKIYYQTTAPNAAHRAGQHGHVGYAEASRNHSVRQTGGFLFDH